MTFTKAVQSGDTNQATVCEASASPPTASSVSDLKTFGELLYADAAEAPEAVAANGGTVVVQIPSPPQQNNLNVAGSSDPLPDHQGGVLISLTVEGTHGFRVAGVSFYMSS